MCSTNVPVHVIALAYKEARKNYRICQPKMGALHDAAKRSVKHNLIIKRPASPQGKNQIHGRKMY
jgi:hypothetical protein